MSIVLDEVYHKNPFLFLSLILEVYSSMRIKKKNQFIVQFIMMSLVQWKVSSKPYITTFKHSLRGPLYRLTPKILEYLL